MLEFKNISKKYGQSTIVSDISFEIKEGELVVLIGESGCGKTTLLKMINRLITPTGGDILLHNDSIYNQDEVTLRRKIGYVIQQTGLFPHMTVKQNLEIIPKLQKINTDMINNKSLELMQMIGLEPDIYLHRYPYELSGGQQQRIGVARAFACNPDIVLMDEPFSALDPLTRLQLQDELVELQKKVRKTIVFVTHDMDEAVKIADRICLLHNGNVIQYDTVEEMMKNPVNDYVSEFIGKNRIWSSPEFIRAHDIMISDPICASPENSVISCIDKMRRTKVDSLLITDKQNHLMGIAFAKYLRNVENKQSPIKDLMSIECQTVPPEMNIIEILDIVTSGSLSSIPVVDANRKLLGLITKSSLLTTLSQQYSDAWEVTE